jgi:Mn2+/Fe2+ NRAMP family transporter
MSYAPTSPERPQAAPRLARARLWLRWLGPGILVMVADNEAGSVLTYLQTGHRYGLGFYAPALLMLGAIAYVVQEMALRLGVATGRGHAELIWQRFGRGWGAFALIDLLMANGLTLVTEFIGVATAAHLLGIPKAPAVAWAYLLVLVTFLAGRYWRWERTVLVIAACNVALFLVLAGLSPFAWGRLPAALVDWSLRGGWNADAIYFLLANIGTTIAPWMLFFQQSAVVDKAVAGEQLRIGQVDTAVGSLLMVAVAISLLITAEAAGGGSPMGLSALLGAVSARLPGARILFPVALAVAALTAALTLTASTCWATAEALGGRPTLNSRWAESPLFYGSGLGIAALAASVVMVPALPLAYLNLTVQVVDTVLMPAALLFLLLLANDRELVGSYVNRPWQNLVGVGVMGLLIAMNLWYGLMTAAGR